MAGCLQAWCSYKGGAVNVRGYQVFWRSFEQVDALTEASKWLPSQLRREINEMTPKLLSMRLQDCQSCEYTRISRSVEKECWDFEAYQ